MPNRNQAEADEQVTDRIGTDSAAAQARFGVLGVSLEDLKRIADELSNQHQRQVNLVIYNFHGPTHFNGDSNMANDQYHVKNSGPVGAQAIGPSARADNRGAVTQHLTPEQVASVVSLFAELRQLLAAVQLSNSVTLEETRRQLDSTIQAVEQNDVPAATTAWSKAKAWIISALDVGAFAATSATKVRELVEQIGSLWQHNDG